jgi:hypothetical protein
VFELRLKGICSIDGRFVVGHADAKFKGHW